MEIAFRRRGKCHPTNFVVYKCRITRAKLTRCFVSMCICLLFLFNETLRQISPRSIASVITVSEVADKIVRFTPAEPDSRAFLARVCIRTPSIFNKPASREAERRNHGSSKKSIGQTTTEGATLAKRIRGETREEPSYVCSREERPPPPPPVTVGLRDVGRSRFYPRRNYFASPRIRPSHSRLPPPTSAPSAFLAACPLARLALSLSRCSSSLSRPYRSGERGERLSTPTKLRH